MKKWLNENKVLLFGAIGAIAVILQQYIDQPVVDYKIIGFAVVAGIAAYFAKNLRGQWASIVGIFGNLVGVVATQVADHKPISWMQLIIQAVVMFGMVVAPPAKSVNYERTDIIKEAKTEAAQVDADKKIPPPVGK